MHLVAAQLSEHGHNQPSHVESDWMRHGLMRGSNLHLVLETGTCHLSVFSWSSGAFKCCNDRCIFCVTVAIVDDEFVL